METKIIAIMNHKGGCGKTTTTINVADEMARRGLRVLVVDLDTQANLTYFLNGDTMVDRGVYDCLLDGGELPIYKQKENFYILPSAVDVTNMDAVLEVSKADATRLAHVLTPVRGVFDFVLLDCPPGLGVLTYNAVVAADHIVVTMEPCILSNVGLTSTIKMVRAIKDKGQTRAEVDGVVFTRYKVGRNLHKGVEQIVRRTFGDMVFRTTIRENIAVAESVLYNKPVWEYKKACNGAKDYGALTREMVDRYAVKS